MPGLSHRSLRRVLQSLITATLSSRSGLRLKGVEAWTDDLPLGESTGSGIGCDSLDLLQVSSAVNEMFQLYQVSSETRLLQATTFGDWLAIIEDAWRSGVDGLTVSTSGSTGRPKFCPHTFAALDVEAAFLADFFRSRRRIVTYTPAHHIYGILFGGLLPDHLGIPVIHLLSAGTQTTGGGMLQPGDLVVSFPDGWSWIDRNVRMVPEDVEGVTSTAPCPRLLLESLMNGKLSRVVEVYGSSETAGIGTRVWPEPHYRLMPHLQRIVSGSDGLDILESGSGQPLPLMDHLEFFADNTFLVNGRRDGCVQVGGVNVFLPYLEQRLREHADVAEVSVQLMSAEEGQRLECHLVPKHGCDVARLKRSLRERVALWPKAAERPVAFHFGLAAAPSLESIKDSVVYGEKGAAGEGLSAHLRR